MALIVRKNTEPRIVPQLASVVPTALDDGNIRKDEILVDYESAEAKRDRRHHVYSSTGRQKRRQRTAAPLGKGNKRPSG